ncbi:MAG: hypothetical protein JNM63_15075 [Spirochaetia bacterium]|nr:hypothetical protein [Spirochaetia bacterium]
MKMSRLKLVWMAGLLGASFLRAEGFDMLQIRLGGVSAALGNGGNARSGTVEGLFQNPASVSGLRGMNALASINPYLGMTLWSGGGTMALGEALTLGASAYGLFYGEFGSAAANPGSKIIDAKDFVAGATAGLSLQRALKLSFGLDLGITGRVSREYLDSAAMTAVLADAGALFTTPVFLKWHSLSLGATLRHLGRGFAEGSGGSYALPSGVSFGAAYQIKAPAFTLLALGDVELGWNAGATASVGMELGFFQIFSARAGYVFGDASRSFTLGAGGKLSFEKCEVFVDYSVTPFGELGIQHNFQFSAALPGPVLKPVVSPAPVLPAPPKKKAPTGFLVGANLIDEVRELLRSGVDSKKFSEDRLIAAENGATWARPDLVLYSQLAAQIGAGKLLVILAEPETQGKVLIFDAEKSLIEKETPFSLPPEVSNRLEILREKLALNTL